MTETAQKVWLMELDEARSFAQLHCKAIETLVLPIEERFAVRLFLDGQPFDEIMNRCKTDNDILVKRWIYNVLEKAAAAAELEVAHLRRKKWRDLGYDAIEARLACATGVDSESSLQALVREKPDSFFLSLPGVGLVGYRRIVKRLGTKAQQRRANRPQIGFRRAVKELNDGPPDVQDAWRICRQYLDKNFRLYESR